MTMIVIVLSRALPSINRILYNYSQIKYATESINSVRSLIELTDNKNLGFKEVIIDLNGYRRGSMNKQVVKNE